MKECEPFNSLDDILSLDEENQFIWSTAAAAAGADHDGRSHPAHSAQYSAAGTDVKNSGNGFCEISSSPDR